MSKGYTGINPMTGNFTIDETINRAARKKGQWEQKLDGDYDLFDRAGYIEASLKVGRPVVITWVPSTVKLRCRHYTDAFGVPDLFGIEEILTLFSGKKGMENHRIFLIPYLITGYGIPPELEQDPEPLVPFTVRTIEIMKEIEELGGGEGMMNFPGTWKCHICGEERPDNKISVLSKPLVINGQVVPGGGQNIRYCNDRPACIEEAKEFSFFKAGKKSL